MFFFYTSFDICAFLFLWIQRELNNFEVDINIIVNEEKEKQYFFTPREKFEKLKEIFDPEIPVNIYDLGLIYDVDRQKNGNVYVTMSLTAPGCPVAGEMPGQVARALAAVDGVGEVSVELVWSPPWTPERMSDDARLALDL
mgnify:CR=1 FL=1